MIVVPSGVLSCWQDFSLCLEHNLEFHPGTSYYLSGNNGSGKSSFITQILLPLLQLHKDTLYRIYVQQLFHKQGYAIKAHAAIHKPNLKLRSEEDCLQYLLNNLQEAFISEQRPVFFIADESHYLPLINSFFETLDAPCCLIYCEHGDSSLTSQAKTIVFQPLSTSQTKVYESLV